MDVFRAQDAASKAVTRAAKTADSFENFLSKLGINNDNTLSAGTYDFNLVTRNRILLEAAYRGSWIVGKVVDCRAEDMTRAGVDITTSAKVDLKLFKKAVSRLQIQQSICTNIKWGRLYGGSLGVLQIKGQDLATPLNLDTIGKGQFQGLVVFDRWQLNPILDEVIDSGPEMGLPAYYQIVNNPMALSTNASVPAAGIINVHHSRVIRYTGIDLPYYQAITEMMWGESVLERLWDRLISFDNATLSSASLIDRANLRTVSIDGLREIIAAGGEALDGLKAHFEMMRLLQVNEGLTLLDALDKFESTAYSFTGLSDMMLQFGQQLAGAADTPMVRLFSQSPAGLNATGEADLKMYNESINAQQEAKLRNPYEVLIKVMWRSVFAQPSPEDLEFTFASLNQMSPKDKADIGKTNTETILSAYDGTLIPQATAMRELRNSSGDSGLFSNITDEDIAAADEELPEPADEAPLPDEGGETENPDKPAKATDGRRLTMVESFYNWFTA